MEIAGPAGTDLGGWSIVRYNGSTPAAAIVYTSPAATETLPPGTIIPGNCGAFRCRRRHLSPGRAAERTERRHRAGRQQRRRRPVPELRGARHRGERSGRRPDQHGHRRGRDRHAPSLARSLQLQGTGTVLRGLRLGARPCRARSAPATQGRPSPGDAAPSVAQTVPANGSTGVGADDDHQRHVQRGRHQRPRSRSSIDCGAGGLGFTLAGGPQTYTLDPDRTPPVAGQLHGHGVRGRRDRSGSAAPDHPADDTAFAFSTAAVFACGEPATRIHDDSGKRPDQPAPGRDPRRRRHRGRRRSRARAKLLGFYLQEDRGRLGQRSRRRPRASSSSTATSAFPSRWAIACASRVA